MTPTATSPGGPTAYPAAPRAWRAGTFPWLPEQDRLADAPARTRVIVDNDFAGDPDDLFQLAHHLLVPGTEVVGVVVSRLSGDDPWNRSGSSVRAGHERVERLLAAMGVTGVPLYDGDDRGFADHPEPTQASRLIVKEAMREDDRPLYLAAGGSLGDVARALRAEPALAQRLTLIWIGGAEHPGLATPPAGAPVMEYNTALDPQAARYVFNDTQATIWQVPRNTYRSAAVSVTTIRRRCSRAGTLGRLLADELAGARAMVASLGGHPGGTYVLGDQPLVLLSSLQTAFEPDTASSSFRVVPTPLLAEDGTYRHRERSRPMRVYTTLDNAMLLNDMFDAFAELATWLGG